MSVLGAWWTILNRIIAGVAGVVAVIDAAQWFASGFGLADPPSYPSWHVMGFVFSSFGLGALIYAGTGRVAP